MKIYKNKIIIFSTITIISLIIIISIVIITLTIPKPILQTGYKTQIILKNLNTPWELDFLPDNNLIFTERGGKVKIFNPKTKQIQTILSLDIPEIGESGLLGLTMDPDFKKNNYIYLYYTTENQNQVSRFTLINYNQNNQTPNTQNQNNITLINEVIIIDKIPNAKYHDGGRIKFGPDGKLYITTGDATSESSAQDINSKAGKILRINKDGSIPNDNPFQDNPTYSYGHRNPQGLTWDKKTNQLYSSEHGKYQNDEINIIKKGKNYGWPNTECDEISQIYENPIKCFSESTLAPSGITFHNNILYVAGLRGTQIRKLTLNKNGTSIISEEKLFSNLGRLRNIVEHDNKLYMLTNNKDGRGIPKFGDDKIIQIEIIN